MDPVDRIGKRLDVRWPLRRNDAMLGETPAQCVNELGRLAYQQITHPKDHCAGLLLGLCRNEA